MQVNRINNHIFHRKQVKPDSSPVCFIKEPITPNSIQIVSEDIERRKASINFIEAKKIIIRKPNKAKYSHSAQ